TDDPNGKTRKVQWTFSDNAMKQYPGPLVTRVWTKPRTITATALVAGLPRQQIQVRVMLPALQLVKVTVTATRVTARVKANAAGTVKLGLGKLGTTSRKLKKGKTFTWVWNVGGRPRLRTMMLLAQLKPSGKTELPGQLKLYRAVVLPLR